ncbi:hypothetical protein, partial [Tenacibaculum maritimum]|uniref:hypothetical protein n=1 Tax=Tenacibaculum maritimum TaxID=107401 RepID=UPI00387618A7
IMKNVNPVLKRKIHIFGLIISSKKGKPTIPGNWSYFTLIFTSIPKVEITCNVKVKKFSKQHFFQQIKKV